MAARSKDPTDAIRRKASRYAGAEEGTSCSQTSFKVGKTAFLYIGMQGGRYKAMFKLKESLDEAAALAEQSPDCFEVGSTSWVTARFTAEEPMPKSLWEKWLEESHALSAGTRRGLTSSQQKKAGRKKTTKKTAAKKTISKKASRKKTR